MTVPSSTVATVVSLELQATNLSVAFDGVIFAVKVLVSRTSKFIVVSSNSTPVTWTTLSYTVTLQIAFAFGLSSDIAVIVTVPGAIAVIVPFVTVAIKSSLELQLTFWFVASAGIIVGIKVRVSPKAKAAEDFIQHFEL